jgi:hypothetical protein
MRCRSGLGVGAGITGFSLSLPRSDISVPSLTVPYGWLLAVVTVGADRYLRQAQGEHHFNIGYWAPRTGIVAQYHGHHNNECCTIPDC